VGGDGRLFAGLGAGNADQMGKEGEDRPARQPDRSGRALRSRHCRRIAAERDRAADGVSDIYEFGEPRR